MIETAPILDNAYVRLQMAASHAATSRLNARRDPTARQAIAGNYKKAPFRWNGLLLMLENVLHSVRSGTSPDGTEWANRLAAHYGEIAGTVGNDGDPIDVFVGLFPELGHVWVINQGNADGSFDEHKCMLGFATEEQARDAYMFSFDRGWTGLQSIVPATLAQFKWWLKHGDKSRQFSLDQLPFDGQPAMSKTLWNADAEPTTLPMNKLLYSLRTEDAVAGLLLDAVAMSDIMSDPDITAVPMLDALVVEVARMTQKMNLLQKVMNGVGSLQVPAYQISDPVKSRGVMQVAVLFELSDGQTVTVWFHNPDTTPAKLMPLDELISWKWMLNKKDITIVVAPEHGRDLQVREVARRIMKLAERNGPAFAKANAKLAQKIEEGFRIDGEIAGLEKRLAEVTHQVEVARQNRIDAGAVATGDTGPAIPFLMMVEGKGNVCDGETGDVLPGDWTGVCVDSSSIHSFWYIGRSGGERSFTKLQATTYEAALAEAQATIDSEAAEVAPAPEPQEYAIQRQIRDMQAVVASEKPAGITLGFVMNAPRPLLGHETAEGDFLTGRFYAGIDITDSMAKPYIDENVKLDARAVFFADESIIDTMAFHTIPARYQANYLAMPEEDRGPILREQRRKLIGLTYGELEDLSNKTMPEGAPATWRSKYLVQSFDDKWRVTGHNFNPISPSYATKEEAEAAAEAFFGGAEFPLPPEYAKPAAIEPASDRSGTAEEQAAADAALAMAAGAVAELGGTFAADGHAGAGVAGAWSYGNAEVNGATVRLAASGGGVVQVDGKPHGPDGELNLTAEQVKAAILAVAPAPVEEPAAAVSSGEIVDLTAEEFEALTTNAADASIETVKGWSEEEYGAKFAGLEADNLHDDALVLMAKRLGGSIEVGLAEAIRAEQDEAGYLTPELSDRAAALRERLRGMAAPAAEPVEVAASAPAVASNDVAEVNALKKLVSKDAIKSDDPDAIAKLQAKLAFLEAYQSLMVRANKAIRANKDDVLIKMGFTQAQIDGLKKPDFAGRIGFADYMTSNNNAEIGRTRKRLKALMAAQTPAGGETAALPAAKGDISYRAVDDMFTSFYPDSEAGEGAWSVINATEGSEGGKVLTQHAASVIEQLRAAGYTVTEAAPVTETADELAAALAEPVESAPAAAEPTADQTAEVFGTEINTTEDRDTVLTNYIKISADSLAELRKVDVERVLMSVVAGNVDGVTRDELGAWISAGRPDLADEVRDVLAEAFPAMQPTAASEAIEAATAQDPALVVSTPSEEVHAAKDADEEADRAFLNGLIDGTGDLLSEDTFPRMEPMFAKYPEGSEMFVLLEKAATVFGDAVQEVAKQAMAA